MLFNRRPRRGWWTVEMDDGLPMQVFARYADEAIAIAELGDRRVKLFTIPTRNKDRILL